MDIDLLRMYGELTTLLKQQGKLTEQNNLMWEVAYGYKSKRQKTIIILTEDVEGISLKLIHTKNTLIALGRYIELQSASIMDSIIDYAHSHNIKVFHMPC